MKEEAVLTGERFSAFDNNQSLKIMNAETSDSGKYECVAKNTEGSSSITALLDVKGTQHILTLFWKYWDSSSFLLSVLNQK